MPLPSLVRIIAIPKVVIIVNAHVELSQFIKLDIIQTDHYIFLCNAY